MCIHVRLFVCSRYKDKSGVAVDVRQIWLNCEIFNEDDSEVGLAGHSIKAMFCEKWKTAFPDDNTLETPEKNTEEN